MPVKRRPLYLSLVTDVTDVTVRFPEFKQNKFFITGMSLTPMAKKYAH